MSVEPALRDELLAAIPSLRAYAFNLSGSRGHRTRSDHACRHAAILAVLVTLVAEWWNLGT